MFIDARVTILAAMTKIGSFPRFIISICVLVMYSRSTASLINIGATSFLVHAAGTLSVDHCNPISAVNYSGVFVIFLNKRLFYSLPPEIQSLSHLSLKLIRMLHLYRKWQDVSFSSPHHLYRFCVLCV